jgi:hypothetical protein
MIKALEVVADLGAAVRERGERRHDCEGVNSCTCAKLYTGPAEGGVVTLPGRAPYADASNVLHQTVTPLRQQILQTLGIVKRPQGSFSQLPLLTTWNPTGSLRVEFPAASYATA